MPTIPPISTRTERFVRFLRKHAWPIVIGATVLCAASTLLATRLQLKTDLAELLPTADPSVRELRRLQAHLPGMQALIVNIHSPDRTANVRFADELAARVEQLPPGMVAIVRSNLKTERAWFEQHKWLYPRLADLERLRDKLQAEIQKRKNPLFIDLDDGESLEKMQARLEHEAGGSGARINLDKLEDGYFITQDGQTAMVVILPPSGIFQEHAGERLVSEVRRLADDLQPASRGIAVGLSGDIESNLEERDALENDLVWATALCVLLVCIVVVAFYGRLRAVPLMAAPALVGTCVAFGIAELAFGYINSSTAFLASIIIGNGINFAIIQLARYEEERQIGVVPEVALVRAVAATIRATAIAALAASVSYGSLVLTRFRGFSQFGVIGGVGMVLAWGATICVLPSVLWLLDRRRAKAREGGKPPRGPWFADSVARLSTRAPRALLALGLGISVVALVVLPRYARDPFEYNFRNLRSARGDSMEGESRWLDANNAVFGRALNPIVILTERSDQLEPTRRALRAADARGSGPALIDKMISIDDLLPGTPVEQQGKVAVLGDIRKLFRDPSFKLLDDKERADLAKYEPPAVIPTVAAADLPVIARRPFTEANGTIGRVMLIFPKDESYSPWDGRYMMRLAERVGEVRLPDGSVVRSAGTPVVFAAMVRSIVHDGPRATLASALGVMLLVVALARGLRGAALVIGTLGAGVVWMLGGAAALGLRVNFLNFVALPVTLGIGVDYGINIYLRYRLEGPGRLFAAVRATGGAVALCSCTTIIGYGALLVADNRGLRSFGSMAILGEIACLLAALIFMPAVLALRDRRLGLARRLETERSPAVVPHVVTNVVEARRDGESAAAARGGKHAP